MKHFKQLKTNLIFNICGIVIWAFTLTVLCLGFGVKAADGSLGVLISYFKMPGIIIVNFIPVLLTTLFFAFVSNRMWISWLASSAIVITMSLTNYFKIMTRNDPFVTADLKLIGEAADMTGRYELPLDAMCILTLVLIVCCIVASAFLFGYRIKKPLVRIGGAVAAVALFVILIKPVYLSDGIYAKIENIKGNGYMNEVNKNDQFICRGFVYSFLHSIRDVYEIPPENYSNKRAKELIKKYSYDNIPDDRKINVISVMLEAFNDFSRFDTIEFTNNPYEYFHELQSKSVHGYVFTNVFGGGTVNSERSFITGYSTQPEYHRATNSYVHYLRQQGYTVEGGHPGHKWFYNRDVVNRYLGFENYKFFETGYSDIYHSNPNNGTEILDDQYLFDDILQSFENNKTTGKPYFNFSVSYQNHGPYNTDALDTGVEYVKQTEGLSDQSYYIINNYLAGIEKTLIAIKDLTEKVDAMEEPVMIVLFGDHNPWLGNEASAYRDMEINLNFDTDEGLYNYFSTPYIIYTNAAAKEITGNSAVGEGGDFGIMYLMNKVFDVAGWKGNEFMKTSNALRQELDIVTNIGICRENGKLTPNIKKNALQELGDFRIVQYYWRNEINPEKISEFAHLYKKTTKGK